MTYIDDLLMTLSFLSFLKVIDYIGHRNHVKYKIRVMQLFIYIYMFANKNLSLFKINSFSILILWKSIS